MTNAQEIIDAARECLGTPYRHQGRVPGRRLDCVGLIRWPVVALGLAGPEFEYRTYKRDPNPPKMREILLRYFEPTGSKTPLPGSILWLRAGGPDAQHLAIYTEKNTIIHAVSDGPQAVVEHSYRQPWPGRVIEVFKYKGVDYEQ